MRQKNLEPPQGDFWAARIHFYYTIPPARMARKMWGRDQK